MSPALSRRSSRFLDYEVEVIDRLALPVVFANLNGSRRAQADKIPFQLSSNYTMSVSFQPAIIKYALDEFVDGYAADRLEKPASTSTSRMFTRG